MKIIRKVQNYTLLKKSNIATNLVYYIDNGEEVSEYMDLFDIQDLLVAGDEMFIKLCKNQF